MPYMNVLNRWRVSMSRLLIRVISAWPCPYQEIIEIYDEIMKMIVDYDGWGFDSDNNYQVYEASYFNIQQEFERKLEEDTNLRKSRHK